jgi:hypothetical protein
LLLFCVAYIAVEWVWPVAGAIEPREWSSYAAALSSVAASMVSLTVAVTAVLYALLGTPIVKFLHEKGALNRLLFDLMTCAVLWLIALGLGLLGSLPSYSKTQAILHFATLSAATGLLYFGPIGYAFWLLLKHAGDKPPPALGHDFNKPTDLR